MTILQKLQIKASEQRARLNAIAGLEGDALTDEVRAEEGTLQTEFRDTETKLRAAIASDPGPVETRHADSPEVRELRALISGSDVGAVFESVLEHRQTKGREARAAGSLRRPVEPRFHWPCSEAAGLSSIGRPG